MSQCLKIGDRIVGKGHPTYVVAEMSANHHHSFEQAVQILHAAAEAGADAMKLQTYTPDTMTIACDNDHFLIGEGTIWKGRRLYDLYGEACTPWEWQPRLKAIADELGIDLFSTAFDPSSVDFLEDLGVDVHKIASFEVVDIPLLRKIGSTGKPAIMSTGMATLAEIDEAVRTLRLAGTPQLGLLKCTSSYPARPEEMNLRSIPHLAEAFGVPVGLSDHTLDPAVAIAAVALGACLVEKHFTLSRGNSGPDSAFSLEPQELKDLVQAIRVAEKAAGTIHYGADEREAKSRAFRRSLFVVEDVRAQDAFTEKNVRCIRPSYGLHPRHLSDVLGRRAAGDIPRGTPLSWDLIAGR